MTRKPRYTLLILGIVFFAIAAPTLVLYVQGKLPLPGNRRMQPTGIISVASDPSGAEVYVNGRLHDTTPTAIRFLSTGDYNVRVHKDGYWDWHKKLSVVAGHVTYANPNPNKQILLKQESPKTVAEKVDLYAPFGKGVVFNNGTTLTILPSLTKTTQKNLTLTEPPIRLITHPNSAYILIKTVNSVFVLNGETLTLRNITKQLPDVVQTVLHEDQILALTQDNTLLSLSLDIINTQVAVLASHVTTFRARESDLYYGQKNGATLNLHHAVLDSNGLSGDQILAKNIPALTPELYVDSNKAVFLLSSNTLYRINAQAEVITAGVSTASDQTGTLSYTTAGELWWYDSGSNTGRLVSRSSEGYADTIIDPNLQHALFVQGTQLVALELDDRGEQNRYMLDTSDHISTLQYLNAATLTYLANNSLRILTLQ